ncbi:MAG: hypothetical protein FWH17_04725 [Oscillospiraceae bacterium]|nr:hypothetical protein [Oscillospiraceae bacterium]
MSTRISPLELLLDDENPRFVVLSKREQADIRKYLLTYEEVCDLATAINTYGSLLPGERIVVLKKDDKYVVVEGNRRTCSLQLLLSRDLIPSGFEHKIPSVSDKLKSSSDVIEVDVLPDRDAALELMTKRHIEGVKQWKPLAKKQFFAANYQAGQSIQNLSRITGISESEIKGDIRDYKFFLNTYNQYCLEHSEFNRDIIEVKTDPFWRIFKAKFEFPVGTKASPTEILKISYDNDFNIVSALDSGLFAQITLLVFESTIVTERANTRNVLSDIDGIMPLLEQIIGNSSAGDDSNSDQSTPSNNNAPENDTESGSGSNGSDDENPDANDNSSAGSDGDSSGSGGPSPGGPGPRSFFESISWQGKVDPVNQDHQGLLVALNELYRLSTVNINRQKSYKTFPIATGMVLRTVYEQALKLRMIQTGQWSGYCSTLRIGAFPSLGGMENHINQGSIKPLVFPDQNLLNIYDRVVAATHRQFLNANIHYPGNINVTPDSLEGVAAAGMYALIQGIINLL